MCTFNITVDERKLSEISPAVSHEEFGRLLQIYVDELVNSLASRAATPPCAYTDEEMYAIVKERVQRMEDGSAEFVDGETAFEQLRARYGFKGEVA